MFAETQNEITDEYELGGLVDLFSKTESSEFSTTWSFTTSTDHIHAGPDSDVFVVPNINVKYRTVAIVEWNQTTCGVRLDDDGELPEEVIFELEGSGNEPAMSFYTRWHVNRGKTERALSIVAC